MTETAIGVVLIVTTKSVARDYISNPNRIMYASRPSRCRAGFSERRAILGWKLIGLIRQPGNK
jgi:hypothetical protein